MSITTIKKYATVSGELLYKKYQAYRLKSVVKKQISNISDDVPQLTQEQRRDIENYWGKYGMKVPTVWHQLLYFETGMQDPKFVPEQTFIHDILPCMREKTFVSAWGDKSYLDYFIRGVNTVKTVLRNVSGRYLNENFELVSFEQAQKLIDTSYKKLVVKPTTNTDTGKGVQLLHAPFDLRKIDEKYKCNFVLQVPLNQNTEIAKLNSSSVNTIRVNSVLLETEVYVMSAFVKVGQAGEFADNHGHERFFIGIKSDGTYCDYAINHDMKKFKKIPSGYEFANQPVPYYHDVCDAVMKAHKCIPHFGLAFWDVCIQDNGMPAIVEVNLRHPNAAIAQAAAGPFFGKYTDQVLEYVGKKQKR